MRNTRFSSTICVLLTSTALVGQVPKEMDQVWSEFKVGLQAKSPEKIAQFIQFPIRVNDFSRTPIPKSQFKLFFSRIFTPEIIAAMLKSTPKKIKGFRGILIDTNDPDSLPLAFGFELVGGHYRLTYIDNGNADYGWGRVPFK